MAFSYKKLWKLLIDKDMNKTDLQREASISSNIIARMGKDLPVAMDTLEKICIALDCNIGDVVEIVKGDG